MNLEAVLADASKRSMAKVVEISGALLDGRLTAEEWSDSTNEEEDSGVQKKYASALKRLR